MVFHSDIAVFASNRNFSCGSCSGKIRLQEVVFYLMMFYKRTSASMLYEENESMVIVDHEMKSFCDLLKKI